MEKLTIDSDMARYILKNQNDMEKAILTQLQALYKELNIAWESPIEHYSRADGVSAEEEYIRIGQIAAASKELLKEEIAALNRRQEMIIRLRLCMRRIPPEDFNLLQTVVVSGTMWKEAAVIYHCSVSTISSRIRAATDALVSLFNSDMTNEQIVAIAYEKPVVRKRGPKPDQSVHQVTLDELIG